MGAPEPALPLKSAPLVSIHHYLNDPVELNSAWQQGRFHTESSAQEWEQDYIDINIGSSIVVQNIAEHGFNTQANMNNNTLFTQQRRV